MKIKIPFSHILLLALFVGTLAAGAQGTAFTYQGQFSENGVPYTGAVELQPTLWDAATGGTQIAANNPATVVVAATNGLMVIPLDFGASFLGAARWLQIEARTVIGPFTILSPRQQLTPTPYAMSAGNLTGLLAATQLKGNVPSTNLSGTYFRPVTFNNAANSFSGSGAGLIALNASQLTSGTVPAARLDNNIARTNQVWLLGGNSIVSGATPALGTLNNQPLEIRVNNLRAFRFEPNTNGAPNLIGGSPGNYIGAGVIGATIAGGGASHWGVITPTNSLRSNFGFIGGGNWNKITDNSDFASIVGGFMNEIAADCADSTIGGGYGNKIKARSPKATIAGGHGNVIETNADFSTISGGHDNLIESSSTRAIIGSGDGNKIGTNCSYAVIPGGYRNYIESSSVKASIAGGSDNWIRINSIGSAIAGGMANIIEDSELASITGGIGNRIYYGSDYSFVGGDNNTIMGKSSHAVITAGRYNEIGTNSSFSVIAGGQSQTIEDNASYAVIAGGHLNRASSYSFAAGYKAYATNRGAFVWSDSNGTLTRSTTNNSVTFRASGGYRFFTGTGNGGAQLRAGETSWSVLSDKNMKRDITPADCGSILDKLSRVPVFQWHYPWEDSTAPLNLGPMAQDFKAAFFPGRDDTTINTLEFDGVALAAIQGLNQKLEQELKRRDAENASLRQRLGQLEQLVKMLAQERDLKTQLPGQESLCGFGNEWLDDLARVE